MKRSLFLLVALAGILHAEDYTYTTRSTSLIGEVTGYDNVTASGLSSGWNGAVGAIKNNNEYSIRGNVNVNLSGCSSDGKGGVFLVNQSAYATPQLYTSLHISDNSGDVTISNNHASTGGGVIAAIGGGSSNPDFYSIVNISGNAGEVKFSGNNADDDGGAILADGKVSINNNGTVLFTDNAVNIANGNWGGAIYMGVSAENALSICGNDYVEFRGNYLYKAKSTYLPDGEVRLNSVYQKSTDKANTISARTGGKVVFYDSVITESAGSRASYELNADYTDADGATQKAGGAIVFSGKYVETDLSGFDVAAKITESLTSTLCAKTTLHNGSLSIEDGAILKVAGLTLKEGTGTVLTLNNGTLSSEVGTSSTTVCDVTFGQGSALNAVGVNTLAASALTLGNDSVITLDLTGASLDSTVLTLNVSSLVLGENVKLVLLGSELLREGEYKLIDFGDALDDISSLSIVGADPDAVVFQSGVMSMRVAIVPEPATATLSLLALAGLVARRRRYC